MLRITSLSYALSANFTLNSAAISLEPGQVLTLLGPNGSGKSTFLQLLSRFNKPDTGTIYWKETPIEKLSSRDLAKQIAVVPQDTGMTPPLTVFEYVRLGRTPHRNILQSFTATDTEHIFQALSDCGVLELNDRDMEFLSGGQRQRVRIAKALAQGSKVILLDEPLNHLDLQAVRDIATLIKTLANQGVTFVTSLHQLNVANFISSHVAFVSKGTVYPSVPVDTALTAENIFKHFGVDIETNLTHTGNKTFTLCFPDLLDTEVTQI